MGRQEFQVQPERMAVKICDYQFSAEARYFESSHLINKGYIEPLLALGVIPNTIILRRNYRDVATSLLILNTVPARTSKGQKFLLLPDDDGVW